MAGHWTLPAAGARLIDRERIRRQVERAQARLPLQQRPERLFGAPARGGADA